jgi:uncharacterized protein YbaP (TraB family)
MLRALALSAALIAASAATAAQARCDGPGLLDRLTPDDRAELDSRVADMPYARGLFWEAERDGQTITLVGTMHVPDPRLAPLVDRAESLLADVDLLLLEMTPAEQDTMQSALGRDPSLMFLTEGPTLPELLDESTWDTLSAAARDRNIPPLLAAKFRPWFLMLSLSVPACAMDHMAAGEEGFDFLLMDAAEARDLPMQALEPWDTLFTVFEQGTMEEQLEFLRMGVLDSALQQEMFVSMLDGYFSGDIARVWELGRLSLDYIPDMTRAEAESLFAATEDALLTGRNLNWIPVIEAAAAEHGRIMVASGAAHLPGDTGILALLADRGWTVTPLD